MQQQPRRNEPCPCGSGKRYKECHGSIGSPARPPTLQQVLATGVAAHQRGDRVAARRAYEEALRLDASSPIALHYLGALEWQGGRLEEATRYMAQSIAMDATVPDFHGNLGLVLRDRGDLPGAEKSFLAALALDPLHGEAHNGLGLLNKDRGSHAEAIEHFRRAAELLPQRPEIDNNRGLSQQQLGDVGGALEAYERALAADPARGARYREIEAACDAQQRRDEAALEPDAASDSARLQVAQAALRLCDDPVIRSVLENRAFAGLLLGASPLAWSRHRWRPERLADWKLRLALRRPVGRWGAPRKLEGVEIEVLGEEGLGDTLFYLRWVPALARRGATIILRADRRLEPLLGPTRLFAGFRDLDDGASRGVDSVLAGDLPYMLGEADPHPQALPLAASDARDALRRATHAPRRIALTWRAGTQGGVAAGHSVLFKEAPLDALAQAVDDGTSFIVSVQRAPRAGENDMLRARFGERFVDMSAFNADLGRMLGVLAACEEYVGVSNTNFHLRASLGMNGRVLTPFPPEWRWLGDGPSPWFPGFSVLRERPGTGWKDAFDRLRSELAAR